MKRTFLLITIALILAFTLGSLPISADFTDDILSYEQKQVGVNTTDDWLTEYLPKQIGGTAEWYVLTLSKEDDYDFTAYASALTDYVQKKNNINPVTARRVV